MKDTINTPIKKAYYYIIDFREIRFPKVLGSYYPNKKFAKKTLKKKFPTKEHRFFEIVKGNKLKGLYLTFNKGLKSGKLKKYDYPPECNTDQLRWNFRRQMRVRLRRMGLYFISKTASSIDNFSKKRTRIIPKTAQYKTNTKDTEAKAFKLARKPNYILYIIKNKSKAKRKGWLITLSVVRINLKTGDFSDKRINITSQDFIRPYLLSEAFELIKNIKDGKGKNFMDRYRKEDFKTS